MKRQLVTGLTAGLLGISCLVAQDQPAQQGAAPQPQYAPNYRRTMWDKVQDHGQFTLGGEYFFRRITLTQPFNIVKTASIPRVLRVDESVSDTTAGLDCFAGGTDCIAGQSCSGTSVCFPTGSDDFAEVQQAAFKEHGNGNFGVVFGQYDYRSACDPYFALRARWAGGEINSNRRNDPRRTVEADGAVERRRNKDKGSDGIVVVNDLLSTNVFAVECFCDQTAALGSVCATAEITTASTIPAVGAEIFNDPTLFQFGDQAHEWNGEMRFGYTFAAACRDSFLFTPYAGIGLEGGRMNFFGRQRYWWWYVPVGFYMSYDFWGGFGIGLDADFGIMGRARYVALDEAPVNNVEREMSSRYRWELELPLYYTWDMCFCNGDGQFSIGLVPFWHGWRTKEMLQGEKPGYINSRVRAVSTDFGIAESALTTSLALDGATVVVADTATTPATIIGETFPCPAAPTIQTFTQSAALVGTDASGSLKADQIVVSPRMLNNSWGGRLEIAWSF
jgi:hypothetical protein